MDGPGQKPNESIVAYWVRKYLESAFPEVLEVYSRPPEVDPNLAQIPAQDRQNDPSFSQQPAGNVYKFPDPASRKKGPPQSDR